MARGEPVLLLLHLPSATLTHQLRVGAARVVGCHAPSTTVTTRVLLAVVVLLRVRARFR